MDVKKQLGRMLWMTSALGAITMVFAVLWFKVYYNQIQVIDRLDSLIQEVRQERDLRHVIQPPSKAAASAIPKK